MRADWFLSPHRRYASGLVAGLEIATLLLLAETVQTRALLEWPISRASLGAALAFWALLPLLTAVGLWTAALLARRLDRTSGAASLDRRLRAEVLIGLLYVGALLAVVTPSHQLAQIGLGYGLSVVPATLALSAARRRMARRWFEHGAGPRGLRPWLPAIGCAGVCGSAMALSTPSTTLEAEVILLIALASGLFGHASLPPPTIESWRRPLLGVLASVTLSLLLLAGLGLHWHASDRHIARAGAGALTVLWFRPNE